MRSSSPNLCLATARAVKVAPVVQSLLAHMPPSEFDSPLAANLEASYMRHVATYATEGTLKANVRRVDEFLEFGRLLFSLQGRRATDRAILASDTAARLYLVNLADQNLGKNVVPSAATMIDTWSHVFS